MRRAELYVLLAAENRIVRGEATKNLHHAPTLDRGAFGRSADRDEELTTRENVDAGRGLPRQHRRFAAVADLHSLAPGITRLPPHRHDVVPLAPSLAVRFRIRPQLLPPTPRVGQPSGQTSSRGPTFTTARRPRRYPNG
jgi:hypothetical protein